MEFDHIERSRVDQLAIHLRCDGLSAPSCGVGTIPSPRWVSMEGHGATFTHMMRASVGKGPDLYGDLGVVGDLAMAHVQLAREG